MVIMIRYLVHMCACMLKYMKSVSRRLQIKYKAHFATANRICKQCAYVQTVEQ
jgi:hypothetical protein